MKAIDDALEQLDTLEGHLEGPRVDEVAALSRTRRLRRDLSGWYDSLPDAPIGPGAVLYDTRKPSRRPCCSEGGRCLAHVTSMYRDVDGGYVLYDVWDGTHTTRQYVRGEDLLAMYEPAGWQWPAGGKPTYHLTRRCGVHDHHDKLTDNPR